MISKIQSIAALAGAWAFGAFGIAVANPQSDAVQQDAGYELLRIDGQLVRWLPRGNETAIVIRYAVADRPITIAGARNCGTIVPPDALLQGSGLTRDDLSHALAAAAQAWQLPAAPMFTPTTSVHDADLIIGAQGEPGGIAYTNLTLGGDVAGPGSASREIEAAQVCLNPSIGWKLGFDGNFARRDLTFALTHEFGHVLGLDHPGARGHLMSFRYLENLRAPTAGDRAGVSTLYETASDAERAAVVKPAVATVPASAMTR